MEKQEVSLSSNKEVIAWLAERFPLCFCLEGDVRPLKIGIFQDLLHRVECAEESALSKTKLRAALRYYTSSWRYLHGIKVGVVRVDLDGKHSGELDEKHVEHARKQLEEARARLRARRQKEKKLANSQKKLASKEIPLKFPASKQVAVSAKKKVETPEADRAKFSSKNVEKKNASSLILKDISHLQVGQSIKFKAGKSEVAATVLEIFRKNVRVRLASGLAVIVGSEHLRF